MDSAGSSTVRKSMDGSWNSRGSKESNREHTEP
jgi:hypothetical protein